VRSARRVDSTKRRRSRAWGGISNSINERVEHASSAQTDRRRVLLPLRPEPGPTHHVPLRSIWWYRYIARSARWNLTKSGIAGYSDSLQDSRSGFL